MFSENVRYYICEFQGKTFETTQFAMQATFICSGFLIAEMDIGHSRLQRGKKLVNFKAKLQETCGILEQCHKCHRSRFTYLLSIKCAYF